MSSAREQIRSAVQPEEQRLYARAIEWGTRIGLALLAFGFCTHVLGLLPAGVPLAQLPALWQLPTAQYLDRSGAQAGWAWLHSLGLADHLELAGVGVLTGCMLPGLLALLPHFLRRREWGFVLLCVAESLVIVAAATGWKFGAPS
jgi:hypothetical protein